MKRIVRKGRSYVPKIEGPYEPGCFLSPLRAARRASMGIGRQRLTIALRERRARQRALETPAVPVAVTALPNANFARSSLNFSKLKITRIGVTF